MVHIENGYRSSKAAAGTLCYLAELGPYDHREVQPLDLPDHWKGKSVGGFNYFFCPVTEAIVNRDSQQHCPWRHLRPFTCPGRLAIEPGLET